MILGFSDPTPYDLFGAFVLAACAVGLVAGLLTGPSWSLPLATITRRGLLLVVCLVPAVILLLTPTRSAVVGAGRLLTLWPLFIVDLLLFAAWSWRAGRL
jgi:hypothetical protein